MVPRGCNAVQIPSVAGRERRSSGCRHRAMYWDHPTEVVKGLGG
jgi:hypothetical protein